MTNPRKSSMIRTLNISLTAVAVLCASAWMTGCGDDSANKKAQQRDFAPPPPPPPMRPSVSMADLKLHRKVQFPEDRAPSTQEAADAIAAFASALAAGSNEQFEPLLDSRDRLVLSALVSSGEWRKQTESLEVVRICAINELSDGHIQIGLGIEDPMGAFLSAWEARADAGKWTFTGFAAAPRFASHANELDGVSLAELGLPDGKPVIAKIAAPPPPPEDDVPPPTPSSSGGGSGLTKDTR